jgi:hypothetical protein
MTASGRKEGRKRKEISLKIVTATTASDNDSVKLGFSSLVCLRVNLLEFGSFLTEIPSSFSFLVFAIEFLIKTYFQAQSSSPAQNADGLICSEK